MKYQTLDVSKIASNYSVGGHKTRAGFNMSSEYTLQSASEEILELINKEI
ncbi:MAG: nanoRNase/pAp phosphatase (c-di-AMP/oligoRNAs hydrolase) [Sulfurimonas sp.]|jgi:nanoRNase/pAp phosphatase (c-di-AMP/oligoRNAs hydrolase)